MLPELRLRSATWSVAVAVGVGIEPTLFWLTARCLTDLATPQSQYRLHPIVFDVNSTTR